MAGKKKVADVEEVVEVVEDSEEEVVEPFVPGKPEITDWFVMGRQQAAIAMIVFKCGDKVDKLYTYSVKETKEKQLSLDEHDGTFTVGTTIEGIYDLADNAYTMKEQIEAGGTLCTRF